MRMLRAIKYLLIVNAVTLGMNGVVVWLVIAKTFPALLGVLLVLGFIAGAVWLSCLVNEMLPYQRYHAFHSAPTEKREDL